MTANVTNNRIVYQMADERNIIRIANPGEPSFHALKTIVSSLAEIVEKYSGVHSVAQ